MCVCLFVCVCVLVCILMHWCVCMCTHACVTVCMIPMHALFPSAAQDFSQSGFSADPLTMFGKTMNHTWRGGGGNVNRKKEQTKKQTKTCILSSLKLCKSNNKKLNKNKKEGGKVWWCIVYSWESYKVRIWSEKKVSRNIAFYFNSMPTWPWNKVKTKS